MAMDRLNHFKLRCNWDPEPWRLAELRDWLTERECGLVELSDGWGVLELPHQMGERPLQRGFGRGVLGFYAAMEWVERTLGEKWPGVESVPQREARGGVRRGPERGEGAAPAAPKAGGVRGRRSKGTRQERFSQT